MICPQCKKETRMNIKHDGKDWKTHCDHCQSVVFGAMSDEGIKFPFHYVDGVEINEKEVERWDLYKRWALTLLYFITGLLLGYIAGKY